MLHCNQVSIIRKIY